MGLDQYWFKGPTKVEKLEQCLLGETVSWQQIGYHRKWHELNDFMGSLWEQETPQSRCDNFNCTLFELDTDHLEAISEWADQQYQDDDYVADLINNIIPALYDAHKEGRPIVYHPWW